MKKPPAVLIFASLLFVPLTLSARTNQETVILTTNDGVALECTYYALQASKAPAVILLPDTRCDKRYFGSFPQKLNEAGFAVLAMDFRYKALIAKAGRMDEQIRTIQQQNLSILADSDVTAALDFLSRRDDVDHETIGLVGTSLGSRIAIISGAGHSSVKAMVLVSLSGSESLPGGKPVKELLEAYGNRAVLFMSSEKDWGGNYKAADDNRTYYDLAKGEKELRIWPGSGHGVDIIERSEVMNFVISWLQRNLKK